MKNLFFSSEPFFKLREFLSRELTGSAVLQFDFCAEKPSHRKFSKRC